MIDGLVHEFLNLLSLTQLYIFQEYEGQIISKKNLKSPVPSLNPETSVEKVKFQASPIDTVPKPLPQPTQGPILPESVKIEVPPPVQDMAKPVQSKNFLSFEPLQETALKREESDFRALFKHNFPQYPLMESIPDDTLAKKKMLAWSYEREIPPVLLFSFSEDERQLSFLKNIAMAITLHFIPARALAGKKMEWNTLLNNPALKLIIISDHELYSQPGLMAHYQEIPQHGKHFLQKIPLLLLSDLDLYLKETQLKPLLWRAICRELSSRQPT